MPFHFFLHQREMYSSRTSTSPKLNECELSFSSQGRNVHIKQCVVSVRDIGGVSVTVKICQINSESKQFISTAIIEILITYMKAGMYQK